MKAAKKITVQLVGTRQRRKFTLLDPPFPVVGDLVRLRDAPKTKAGELDWEVIQVEDTQAYIIPRCYPNRVLNPEGKRGKIGI